MMIQMIKKISLVTIYFLFAFTTLSTTQAGEYRGFIAKARKGVSLDGYAKMLQGSGLNIQSEIPQLRLFVLDKDHRIALATQSRPNAFDFQTQYVEPNWVVRLNSRPTRGDSESRDMWNLKIIQMSEAWKITTGSKEVIIAISDTGATRIHADLSDNFWLNPGETGLDENGKKKEKNKRDDDGNGFIDDSWGWNFETNTNYPDDDHYHGTHVSGTAGATGGNKMGIAGVAWKTQLMITKFIGKGGSGTNEGGIRTILYAADNGARAINCSWGSYEFSQALYDAIDYAKKKGLLVVAAAGNDETDTDKTPMYPAAYDHDNIISVAALSTDGKVLSYFSNWGKNSVDLAAPGSYIYSTFNFRYSQLYPYYYYDLDGTSMAAPHVTGALALMFSIRPDLNWQEAKRLLIETVTKIPKLAGKVVSDGYLNVAEALRKTQGLTR